MLSRKIGHDLEAQTHVEEMNARRDPTVGGGCEVARQVRAGQFQQIRVHPAQESPFTGMQAAHQNGAPHHEGDQQAPNPARLPAPLQPLGRSAFAKRQNRVVAVIEGKAGMRDIDDRELDPVLGQRIADTFDPLFLWNEYWHGVLNVIQESLEGKPTGKTARTQGAALREGRAVAAEGFR
jgi:hypothetical protein